MTVLLVLLLTLEGEVKPKAVAMVLEAPAEATVQRGAAAAKPLLEGDFLFPEDRLKAGKNAVLVVFFKGGHSQRLLPGKQATVASTGCTPAAAVERIEAKRSKSTLAALSALQRSNSAGVGVLRSGFLDPNAPSRVQPIHGTYILTRRPAFSWPAAAGAKGYEVRLYPGGKDDRRPLWMASTSVPSLAFPKKQADLRHGITYYWKVTALFKDDREEELFEGKFIVPFETSWKRLEGVADLARGKDPNGWLLAAAIYEEAGAYNAALELYEKLARARPKQANYQRALGYYYRRAGWKKQADAAFKRARELGADLLDK
jgi:hypothetical protein